MNSASTVNDEKTAMNERHQKTGCSNHACNGQWFCRTHFLWQNGEGA